MVTSRCPPTLIPIVILLTGLTCRSGETAEWLAEPSVAARAEYNDNIRLTAAEHDAVWGAILDPKLRLSRRTEVWDMNASGRLHAANYNGQDGLNTVDQFLDFATKRQFERAKLSASASVANDTTFQDERVDLDAGVTTTQVDRLRKEASVAASYLFTEANWLEASLNYSTIKYDDGVRYGLLNYDYISPALRLVHQVNPKLQTFGILSRSSVDYDRSDELESNTDSLQLGGAYDFSERSKITASVGSRRTQTSSMVAVPRPGFEVFYPFIYDLASRDSESAGLVYDGAFVRKFETGTLDLSVAREVTPSSTGTDTDTVRASLAGSRQFSAKLSAHLAVSYFRSETVGGAQTLADRTYVRLSPSASWRLDRDLYVNFGYTHTRVDRQATDAEAVNGNALFLGIGYDWPPLAVSR